MEEKTDDDGDADNKEVDGNMKRKDEDVEEK